jgi:outer membrane protein OmpA-like peptidoglycan-associated protein
MTDSSSDNNGFLTASGGIVYRIPAGRITPFVHLLAGGAYVGGPTHQPRTWGTSLTGGGGLDLELNKHWAIRMFQADIEPMHVDFGSNTVVDRGVADINDAVRLSAGIVYHIGEQIPPPPVTLSLAVNPSTVFAGDPVTVTATPGNLNPKLNAVYGWSGPGVTGNGTSATVATAALAPGTYTVSASLKQGKPGKEGLKPGQSADATVTFTVKAFEPPTASCSAHPTTIKPGDTSTISTTAMSPQNRPLTYSYSATAGSVSGTGNSAVFSSAGAPTGTATVTCNVADDKDHTATATTVVTILAPYVPPVLHAEALPPLSFDAGSARVNNEAKAVLDGIALTLQKQPDAKIVAVGESTAAEKATDAKLAKRLHKKGAVAPDLAAQRAVNSKDYLVKEKGIDASRIGVDTGTADERKVELYLVPAGANFSADVQGLTPVDESMVKPQVRKPLPSHHHHAKAQ